MGSVDSILSRLMYHFGVKMYKDLASKIGVSPNTIDSWKKRGAIPKKKLREIAKDEELSLDWLQNGQGSMKLLEKKSAKETLESWMRRENLETLEALAAFLDQKIETLQEWIKEGEISERTVRRYKLKSIEAFKETGKKYKTDIYSIKEKEFWGEEVFHNTILDPKSAAEWFLEKYDIDYYQIEEAKFVDNENNNISLHVRYTVNHKHELAYLKRLICEEVEKEA